MQTCVICRRWDWSLDSWLRSRHRWAQRKTVGEIVSGIKRRMDVASHVLIRDGVWRRRRWSAAEDIKDSAVVVASAVCDSRWRHDIQIPADAEHVFCMHATASARWRVASIILISRLDVVRSRRQQQQRRRSPAFRRGRTPTVRRRSQATGPTDWPASIEIAGHSEGGRDLRLAVRIHSSSRHKRPCNRPVNAGRRGRHSPGYTLVRSDLPVAVYISASSGPRPATGTPSSHHPSIVPTFYRWQILPDKTCIRATVEM